MLKQVQNHRNQIVFQNPESGLVYRRIVGAVGWPCEPNPGFMLVLGEQFAYDLGLKGRPLQVLAEREVESIAAMHRGCIEMRTEWACDLWLADLKQEEAVRLFRKLNAPLVHIEAFPISLSPAPYSHGDGRLQVLFQMLGMVQSLDRKLLSYGPESRLPGYALSLNPKDLEQPASKFPPLAALGYAVAEMLLREPWTDQQPEKRVVNDWDRFA